MVHVAPGSNVTDLFFRDLCTGTKLLKFNLRIVFNLKYLPKKNINQLSYVKVLKYFKVLSLCKYKSSRSALIELA